MSSLQRQQLTSAVVTLRELTMDAKIRLEALRSRPEAESDEAYLAPLRSDQIQLRQWADRTDTILQRCQETIDKMTPEEKVQNGDFLAAFETGWEELDRSTDNRWPVLKLIERANHYANSIEAFFVVRADAFAEAQRQSQQNSHEEQSRGNTRHNSAASSRIVTREPTPTQYANDTMGVFGMLRQQLAAENALPTFNSQPPIFHQPAQQGHTFGENTQQQLTTANAAILRQRSQPATSLQQQKPAVTFHQQHNAPPANRLTQQPPSAYHQQPSAPPAHGPTPQHQSAFQPPGQRTVIQPQPIYCQPANNSPHMPTSTYLKPVRLEPPKFGGQSREWPTFWAAFKLAVDDQPIRSFEKHLLLLQYIVRDSSAYKAIEAYPPSDENYDHVIAILTERYGNATVLQNQLQAELLHLRPVDKDHWRELRALHENIDRICMQLTSLKANANDSLITNIIKAKLPRGTLLKLKEMEDRDDNVWTSADLRRCLAKTVADQEEVEKYMSTFRPADRQPQREHQRRPDNRVEHLKDSLRSDHRSGQAANHNRTEDTRAFQAVNTTPPPQATHQQQSNDGRRRWPPHCSLCSADGHRPSTCLAYPTAKEREKRLLAQSRCLICLRQNHDTKSCPEREQRTCGHCNRKGHHILICYTLEKEKQPSQQQTPPARTPPPPQNYRAPPRFTGGNTEPLNTPSATRAMSAANDDILAQPISANPPPTTEALSCPGIDEIAALCHREKPRAMLMSRLVLATTRQNPEKIVTCAVFMDCGSETSYISRRLVDQLKPPPLDTEHLRVHAFGSKPPVDIVSSIYAIQLQREDGTWADFELNMVDQISAPIPTQQWMRRVAAYQHSMPNLRCANTAPDVLIGIRDFWPLMISFNNLPNDPAIFIIQTQLGPFLAGETNRLPGSKDTNALVAIHPTNEEAMPKSDTIDTFWNLEAIGIRDDPAQDDDRRAIEIFNQSVQRLPDGRYQIGWVWKDPRPTIQPTWNLAYRRLCSVWRRLSTQPELLKKYNDYFAEQRTSGFLEPTGRDDEELFLPHHGVITPKKLRIVLDASAHTTNTPSLNDCLYPGPVILPDLTGMLLRFRSCAVPVLADIQSTFLTIEINPEDRRFCKIMWLKDYTKPPSSDNLTYERYKRMVFGVNCSPFLLAAVLLRHFSQYDTSLARQLEHNTYVDNILLESDDAVNALKMAREAKAIFADCQMNVREFFSHIPSIMEQLPPEDRLDKEVGKVLGLMWDISNDVIRFQFPSPDTTDNTRRSVLSTLSTLFDPLGLVSPCILPAKLLFQQLWGYTHNWELVLPDTSEATWRAILEAWKDQIIPVQRYSLQLNWDDLQLHIFCDASEHTFATAIYARSTADGVVKTQLIFSKSRLRPLKAQSTYTVPRMELLAILIGVRAQCFTSKELRRTISSTHYWSDSRIALAWVQSADPKQQFEQRRVAEIRVKAAGTFHYIRTDQNPADVATRGATPSELRDQPLWWHGPPWLKEPPDRWPEEHSFFLPDPNDELLNPPEEGDEPALINTFIATTTTPATTPATPAKAPLPLEMMPTIDVTLYSSLLFLIKITILVLRFIGRVRPPSAWVSTSGSFTVCDYRKAKATLIQLDQKQHLHDYNSHPTLINADGLICIKTRLTYCNGPDTMAHPILLARHSPLTRLIVEDIHQQLKHAGTDRTLTQFLSNYWMPKARRTINFILSKCQACRRMKAPPFARPDMPPLPAMRVRPARPFEYIGLDFLGPTNTRQNNTTIKTWIVIIACLVTRAIYLEPTRDQSAPTFMNVLRRFFSRRGRPRRILSDNAPTFIQTSRALDILTGPKSAEPPDVHLAQQGTRWDFIPALSPWMGATYERLISLVKQGIQRTIGKRLLDYDDMSAFLAEVEAAINSRPISWVSDAADAILPLTPNHFLNNAAPTDIDIGSTDIDLDDPNLSSPERLAALWKAYQEAADFFWTRWSTDYLLALRERVHWQHKDPRLSTHSCPKVGDVVLIKEDLRPRTYWPIARVVELNGQPPNVRSVQLRLPNGHVWTRPVNHLCPLETSQLSTEPAVGLPPPAEMPAPTAEPAPSAQTPADQPSTSGHAAGEDGNTYSRPKPPPPPPAHQQSQHRMTTRQRAKMVTFSNLALLAVMASALPPSTASLWPFPTMPCWPFQCQPANNTIITTTTPCAGCSLNCTSRGVAVAGPSIVQKIEVCCLRSCLSRPTADRFTFELAAENLVIDYDCEAWFWPNSTHVANAKIRCPAVDSCQLYSCYFCSDAIQNPTCNPQWATFIYTIIAGFTLLLLGFLLTCCRSLFGVLHFICAAIAFFISAPLRITYWLLGKKFTRADEKKVARHLEAGAHRASQRLRRSARVARQRTNQILGSVYLASLISQGAASSETIAMTTRSESCRRTGMDLTCSINVATVIVERGVRGTSARSLRRQRQGYNVWMAGQPHTDKLPLENPPDGSSSRQSNRSQQNTAGQAPQAQHKGGQRPSQHHNTAGPSSQTQHKGGHPPPPPPSAGAAAAAFLFFLSLGLIASPSSAIGQFASTSTQTSTIDQTANYSVELFIAAHSTIDAGHFGLFISPFTGHFSPPHFSQFPFSNSPISHLPTNSIHSIVANMSSSEADSTEKPTGETEKPTPEEQMPMLAAEIQSSEAPPAPTSSSSKTPPPQTPQSSQTPTSSNTSNTKLKSVVVVPAKTAKGGQQQQKKKPKTTNNASQQQQKVSGSSSGGTSQQQQQKPKAAEKLDLQLPPVAAQSSSQQQQKPKAAEKLGPLLLPAAPLVQPPPTVVLQLPPPAAVAPPVQQQPKQQPKPKVAVLHLPPPVPQQPVVEDRQQQQQPIVEQGNRQQQQQVVEDRQQQQPNANRPYRRRAEENRRRPAEDNREPRQDIRRNPAYYPKRCRESPPPAASMPSAVSPLLHAPLAHLLAQFQQQQQQQILPQHQQQQQFLPQHITVTPLASQPPKLLDLLDERLLSLITTGSAQIHQTPPSNLPSTSAAPPATAIILQPDHVTWLRMLSRYLKMAAGTIDALAGPGGTVAETAEGSKQ